MGRRDADEEDLAIQNTLAMTIDERIELLAALIVDKIAEDQKLGEPILLKAMGVVHE